MLNSLDSGKMKRKIYRLFWSTDGNKSYAICKNINEYRPGGMSGDGSSGASIQPTPERIEGPNPSANIPQAEDGSKEIL